MQLQDIHTINWQMSLQRPDRVVTGAEDVKQCLNTILKTRKGEDPLRPHFGCGIADWVDKPNTTSIPNMKFEILQSVARYEKRIELTKIEHQLTEGGVIFNLHYRTPEGQESNFAFDTTSTIVPDQSELQLSATYDPGAIRYNVHLTLDGHPVMPPPPAGGFASITDMHAWLNDQWYIYGDWFNLTTQNRMTLFVPSDVAHQGQLTIDSILNVLSAVIPQLTDPEGYYLVDFKSNGIQINPVNDKDVDSYGALLDFVQNNYSEYGQWSIDGNKLVLEGDVDLTGFTLNIFEKITVPGAFTDGFSKGFQI